MVDLSRDVPIRGYVMTLPGEEKQVQCESCYTGRVTDTVFTKIIREGQVQSGNWNCDDCDKKV